MVKWEKTYELRTSWNQQPSCFRNFLEHIFHYAVAVITNKSINFFRGVLFISFQTQVAVS